MILILGRNGMLATVLRHMLEQQGEAFQCVGSSDVDLAAPGAAGALIVRIQPDIVLNAAAFTAVDKAETCEAQAFALNASMPKEAAQSCANLGAVFVNVSSDYVFDGAKGAPYVESDMAEPLSVYGRSKLEGEQAVASIGPHAVSLRTSWVLGVSTRNFIATMLRLARSRDEITVVNDQWGRATLVEDIARASVLAGRALSQGAVFEHGVMHVAGPQDLTWFQLAQDIMECAQAQKLPTAKIRPVSSEAFGAAAKRPLDSRMSSDLYAERFEHRPAHFEARLPLLVRQINALLDHI